MSMQSAFAKGIYDKLQADATLVTLVGGAAKIREWIDQSTALPYIVIGDNQHNSWIRKGEDGDEAIASIHLYSEYRGWKEINDIADRVRTVLNGQALTMAGNYSTIGTTGFFEDSNRFIEDDGKRRRMVLTFRYLIQGPAIP